MTKKTVAIIGGGASGLFAASELNSDKFDVTIYEKNKTLGRKFLVAGDGGFNLTHSENIEEMISRYTPISFLKNSLQGFDNSFYREWLAKIGIPTFVGSSKRIFPKEGIKPIQVLNAIKSELHENNVKFKFEETWIGWELDGSLSFLSDLSIKPDIVIFSLGGSSWKKTGSDGSWCSIFKQKEIEVIPFRASNCAYEVNWPSNFIQECEGEPLKNIAIRSGEKVVKGELVVTKFGLEGNAIYALSPEIRSAMNVSKRAIVYFDLKPNLSDEQVLEKWKNNKEKNKTDFLKFGLKLSKVQVKMLKTLLSKSDFLNDEILLDKVKNLPVDILNASPIDEAISTVGGIATTEVSGSFELNDYPNHYCIGEMLNWDTPTGGYLLQGCFSMGMKVAQVLNE